ncbi:MAG: SBBP repeat-containing protein [Bacteroidetes bacterium]|nr:SBBP repeat-containing protein [Bacteroidota bacterium]
MTCRIPLILVAALLSFLPLQAQQWNWATSGGGTSNDDFCYSIATDSQGNVYYAGTTRGSNGQFACGAVSVGATTAAVVAKYSATGQCQWLRTISVPSFEARAYAIAIDTQDRIYVAGSYRGTATFSDSLTLPSYSSSTSIFLARYDTAGTCQWAQRAGGANATSEARGIALSADGGIFIIGRAGGNPVQAGTLQIPNPGSIRQVFLARYDSTGMAQWARISTGTGSGSERSGRGISIQGNTLFVTGQANYASTTFDGLSLTSTSTSGNLYVLACDLQGNAQWARSYSGMSNVEGTGIAADSLGNLFVTGSLWGSLYLPEDTLQSVGSDDDILLLGLDQAGNHRWGHSGGSTARDLAWGVTADGMGNAYVAMQFTNTMELLGDTFTVLGDEDALIMKLRSDGTPVWNSQPSGYQRDIPLCIHRQVVAPHRLLFGGYFWGTITYGSSTISDIQNGDGMLVSGMDTTFAVNIHTTPTCPGDCNGSRTVFINGDGPFDVLWEDGATATTRVDQCAGDLSVSVTDAHGQSFALQAPVAAFTDPGLTVQQNMDSLWVEGGVSWQWYYNGVPLPGEEAAHHIAQFSGSYSVSYMDSAGCAWSSDTLDVVLSVGLEAMAPAAPVLYPSPATDRLWLRNGPPIASVRAWDMAGRSASAPVLNGQSLSIAHWAPGPWMVELRFTDGSTKRFRVMKALE